MPASISTRVMSSSNASSRWSARPCARKCWPESAASARWWKCHSDRYKKPVLVSGTDGVGTKLRLAIDTGRHDKIGIDLVAMCANDVAVSGAEPLFFLDYYATGKLRVDVAESVVRGIAEGCELAGAALVGGETAEMPGMYHGDDYDLAGFCVGVVENTTASSTARPTAAGDVVIGLTSSGPHSNGYSLIRKLVSVAGANDKTQVDGKALFDRLLTPTRIYVKSMLALAQKISVKGFAHITGGGITDNIPRVIPDGLEVVLQRESWAARPGVRLAGLGRKDRQHRDVPHLQLRHRHGGGRGAVRRGQRARAAEVDGRNRHRDRHPGAWLPRRGHRGIAMLAGRRRHLRARQQHGSHRARRAGAGQRLPGS